MRVTRSFRAIHTGTQACHPTSQAEVLAPASAPRPEVASLMRRATPRSRRPVRHAPKVPDALSPEPKTEGGTDRFDTCWHRCRRGRGHRPHAVFEGLVTVMASSGRFVRCRCQGGEREHSGHSELVNQPQMIRSSPHCRLHGPTARITGRGRRSLRQSERSCSDVTSRRIRTSRDRAQGAHWSRPSRSDR